MSTEIEANSFGFTIRRGPGHGSSESVWGDNLVSKDLPDAGARLNFGTPYSSNGFKIIVHFGYTSPSRKDYSRSIILDRGQTIELIRYLNGCINEDLAK